MAIASELRAKQVLRGEGERLGPVIERCGRCGFDIPVDADVCPGCGPARDEVPCLAARQVAGLALPTRSVRRLPHTRPRIDPPPLDGTPARGAGTVFAYTWVLALVAGCAALLGWVARLDRYVRALPHGTAAWLDELTTMATLGSIIGLVIGLIATTVWCIRRITIGIARRQRNQVVT